MLLIPRPNSAHPILITFDCAKSEYFDKTHVHSEITITYTLMHVLDLTRLWVMILRTFVYHPVTKGVKERCLNWQC